MRPRRVARIARWEATKGTGGIDRRTLAVAAVGLLVLGALVPLVASGSVALDRGIYRVGVAESSVFYGPVSATPALVVREPDSAAVADGLAPGEGYDLYVEGNDTLYLVAEAGRPTEKSRAALSELRRAVERYNDRRMAREDNASAAFPVYPVTLRFAEREAVTEVVVSDGDGGDGDDGGGGGSDGAGGGGGDGGGGGSGGLRAPFLGGLFGTGGTAGAPSDITPPFPFGSLVLAFVFVLPLNFVIQAYGSSVLNERINRRGELLLVAPVTRGEIVAGKTLPYLLVSLAVAGVVAVLVGGGPLSVLAVAPLALVFLGATFLGAMFARSFKELTFVTVAVSVFLTSFAFVPAIFTDVSSVALISPLTLVVRDLTNAPVTAPEAAFALAPTTLSALVLFALGAGVYREEDMFTQRPVHLKALDALAARVRRPRSLVVVTAVLVPFVFVAELLAVAALFALPGRVDVVVLLVLVAFIEEAAKGLPVYAGFVNGRYERAWSTALLAGAASGLGFFLGEKLTLVVQLVGLPQVPAARAAFTTGLGIPALPLAVGLLLAPLALHVVTACLSALGARVDAEWFAVGYLGAALLHVAYNLAVVVALG